MDFNEVLRRRRSTRVFLDEPVTRAELDEVLLAGLNAPVGSNLIGDVAVTVLTDRKVMAELCRAFDKRREDKAFMEKAAGGIVRAGSERPHRLPFYGAPVVIIVSHRVQDFQPGIEYANATSLVHTMHLAATNLGLGSVYVWGILEAMRDFPELDRTDLLNLPENFKPLMGLMLGRPKVPLKERAMRPDKLAVNHVGPPPD